MRKVIYSFGAGQLLQLVLLGTALKLTYSDNVLIYCAVLGGIATILLSVGSGLQALEMEPPADVEIEEAPPLPEELEVTQTSVKRAPEKRKTWGSRIADAIETDRKAGGKHEEPSVMEKKLAEVGKDV